MTSIYTPEQSIAQHHAGLTGHRDGETEEFYQIACIDGKVVAQIRQSCSADYQCWACPEPPHGHECRHKQHQRQVACLNNCMIPARYKEATMDVLHNTAEDNETSPAIIRALQWLIRWCAAEPILTRGILLSSSPGTGKSFALAAMLRYLTMVRSQSCLFVDCDHFLMELKQCYHHKANEKKLYDDIRQVTVLVLDDFATGRDSEWANDVMQRIIAYRYNDMKPVFISTNLELHSEMKRTLPRKTYSRLQEMCYWLSFDGPDRRKNKSL